MKYKNTRDYGIILMLIVTFSVVPICHAETSNDKTSIEKVKKESLDLVQTLKAYTATQRDEASQKAKEALDELDKRIDALEKHADKNWDKMDKVAREKVRASLKALQKQRMKVAEWYGSLKNSSAGTWDNMRKGFSDAYSSLHDAWEKSEKEFGSGK